MSTKQELADLWATKAHNHTGSQTFTRISPLWPNILATEGAMDMAGTLRAYWLLDDIGLYNNPREFPKVHQEAFQVWDLVVDTESSTGVLTCGDGNENELHRVHLSHTDFPLPSIKLFCCADEHNGHTIMLPSEY